MNKEAINIASCESVTLEEYLAVMADILYVEMPMVPPPTEES